MSVEDDYNALLNGAIDVATDFLGQYSEFPPFAMAMQGEDGELFHIEPDGEEGEELDSETVMAAMAAGLRDDARNGRWRAVALVADVTLEDEQGEPVTAAIHVAMEHGAGDPISAVVPYSIEGDQVELDELIAEPGEHVVFVTEQPS